MYINSTILLSLLECTLKNWKKNSKLFYITKFLKHEVNLMFKMENLFRFQKDIHHNSLYYRINVSIIMQMI